MHNSKHILTKRLLVQGRVQGVGFRPFVYRLAQQLGITGSVQNRVGTVEIVAQGSARALADFEQALLAQAPAIARPYFVSRDLTESTNHTGFRILPSAAQTRTAIHVPPDYFCCRECLEEINDPGNRRFRYPFTNCTQCGPRYTLINSLPYDRPNTSMADFPLCTDCRAEYQDPGNRRFHAEPIACPACGPALFIDFQGNRLMGEDALQQAVALLRQGEIVAIQGVGGFHLCCDATNPAAIAQLRQRKPRPEKPLAVMFPDPEQDQHNWLTSSCEIMPAETNSLRSPERPIILLQRNNRCSLPEVLAPGLNEIGAFLPYSPLHHLLIKDIERPLVATSGNISGEPVMTKSEDASQRLNHITPHILCHNRPIVRPADDSVMRYSHGAVRPLRLGRGIAPLELPLPFNLKEPVLAVGAHMKLTVALAWEDRIVVSPHIGDMHSLRSQQVFEQVIEDLQQLYQVQAKHLIRDLHPHYNTSRWTRKQSLPITPVAHHHAHASALYGEFACRENILAFAWDGTGLGTDNALWGGETFYGLPGQWQRVASLRPFQLTGGDKAARRPWQSAAALCWEAGIDAPDFNIEKRDSELLQKAWQQQLNTIESSSVGRLFDAASALTGLCSESSFDGQAPMLLEAAANRDQGQHWDVDIQDGADRLLLDWQPWLQPLMSHTRTPGERAADFHSTLAQAILQLTQRLRITHDFQAVGLCGGVFQNRLLLEQAARLLEKAGFSVLIPEQLPCNDAAISFGQVMEFGYRQKGTGNAAG